MSPNQAKEYLKPKIVDYCISTSLAVDEHTPFRCINPAHDDKHPSMYLYPQGNCVKCFGCGITYDLFDLIGIDYGLPDYPSQLRKAAEIFNVDINWSALNKSKDGKYEKKLESADAFSFIGKNDGVVGTDDAELDAAFLEFVLGSKNNKQEKVDSKLVQFIADSKKNQQQAAEYLKKRGIDPSYAQKFGLGCSTYFDKNSQKNLNMVVIPALDGTGAVLRNVVDDCDNNLRYRKLGHSAIWNAPAFRTGKQMGMNVTIVEGEIDALSVLTCGGLAVALGSVSNMKQVVPMLREMFGEDPKCAPYLLLALDNDEEGQKCTRQLSAVLTEHHYPHQVVNLYCGCKDANEALLKYPAKFREYVEACRTVDGMQQLRYRLKFSESAYVPDFLAEVEKDKHRPLLKTGFDALDDVFEGGLYTGLYFVGAIPSLGKTTYILQIADHLASQGNDVLYFSLEMSKAQLFAKSVSRLSYLYCLNHKGESPNDCPHPKTFAEVLFGRKHEAYSAADVKMFKDCVAQQSEIGKHKFVFQGVSDFGVRQIVDAVRRHIAVFHSRPVVFVDYLQILAPYSERMTDKQNLDNNIAELFRLSRDYDIPVIAISSFNRNNYNNASYEAFKDSGNIEYDADVVLALQFPPMKPGDSVDFDKEKSKEPRNIEVVVLKNRASQTGQRIFYYYYARYNYFKEDPKNEYFKKLKPVIRFTKNADSQADGLKAANKMFLAQEP